MAPGRCGARRPVRSFPCPSDFLAQQNSARGKPPRYACYRPFGVYVFERSLICGLTPAAKCCRRYAAGSVQVAKTISQRNHSDVFFKAASMHRGSNSLHKKLLEEGTSSVLARTNTQEEHYQNGRPFFKEQTDAKTLLSTNTTGLPNGT